MLNLEDILNSKDLSKLYKINIEYHTKERNTDKETIIRNIRAFSYLNYNDVKEYINDPEIRQELINFHRFSFFK